LRLSGGWKLRSRLSRLPARWQFVVAWWLIPLLVFLLARSRLPLYVLPLFAPMSLAIAAMLPGGFSQQPRRVGLWTATVLVVLLALRGYASVMPYKKDDRALAEAISAIAAGPYRELIFVDREPRYGLSLYLDAEIEYVCMEKSCEAEGLAQDQYLADEVAQRESPVLYLMRPNAVSGVIEHLQRDGVEVTVLGQAQDLTLIELR